MSVLLTELCIFAKNQKLPQSMKNILYIIIISITLTIATCCNKAFEATYIEIYPTKVSMPVNDTMQMSFSIVYEGGDFEDPNLIQVKWTSSNEAVASVSDSGVVISKVPGLAEITVSCGNVNSSCQVNVIERQDSTTIEIHDM